MNVVEMQVITNEGPGGLPNAKDKFVNEFYEKIDHSSMKEERLWNYSLRDKKTFRNLLIKKIDIQP